MSSLRSKSELKEGISNVAISARPFISKAVWSVETGWPSEGDLACDGSDGRSGEEWDRREKEREEISTAGAMIAVPLIA
jgi:hypothetical protein